MASSYKLTQYIDGILFSGALAVAAVAGMFVSRKDPAAAAGVTSVHDVPEFELSTGKRGYVLLRDVVDQNEYTLEQLIRQEGPGFLSPVLIGGQVTARQILVGEFEGANFLVLAGAQAISTSTPLRSPLTLVGGKLALMTADQIELTVTGRNGAGAQTLAGARVGDKLRSAYNETDNADVTSSFEATITVAGQIQQSAATDFSAKKIRFIVETPNNLQETVARLAGFLEPEDSGNAVRIVAEFVS